MKIIKRAASLIRIEPLTVCVRNIFIRYDVTSMVNSKSIQNFIKRMYKSLFINLQLQSLAEK